MKYRIYFEPEDFEGELKDLLEFGNKMLAEISRILPVDKDGLPLRQNGI